MGILCGTDLGTLYNMLGICCFPLKTTTSIIVIIIIIVVFVVVVIVVVSVVAVEKDLSKK